ncbi:MAG: gamma-glutamyltransferase [Alphaproteobacteria bacterium]|nr:gamma-glutamyltransferase [Alphaproteobacteria bacterium]
MSESLTRQQKIVKDAARGSGVVVAQNVRAAEVGTEVLRAGGNAIDAAVATAMALGTLEPWMSGIGGIGFMTVWDAKAGRAWTIDYGPISARGLDPATYPLTGEGASDLFGWAPVVGNRNIHGYHSIAVPGQVAGMALALERFGTMKWKDLLQPAIKLAERGMELDWYMTLLIATSARELSLFPTSRATYLPGGHPPVQDWAASRSFLKLGNLGTTMRRLAEGGVRDYYEGDLARDIVADLNAGGSPISLADLAAYKARLVDPLSFEHNGTTINVAGGLTAGPTLRRALELTAGRTRGSGAPDAAFFVSVAESMHRAYEERLATMGEKPTDSCTTHFCAADRHGNMVALTQTLLSLFGSRVMLPHTGILMNNGIMWFDPEPGKPNSIAAGKRPLTNICPVVASKDGKALFCIGASGGRRIVPAVAQLSMMMIDRGLDVHTAFHTPRIDISGVGPIRLNRDLPDAVKRAIAEKLPTTNVANVVYPLNFANPSCIARDPATGLLTGMNEVQSPWAGGAAV